MSRYVGALRRIGVLTRQETHLIVYEDALVVAVDDNAAQILAAAVGLGLGNRLKERIRQKAENLTPQELAAQRGNEVIPVESVTSAMLRKTAGGLYRSLDLELTDGTATRLKWQRGDNRDDEAIPVLREALGDKLEITFEADQPSESPIRSEAG